MACHTVRSKVPTETSQLYLNRYLPRYSIAISRLAYHMVRSRFTPAQACHKSNTSSCHCLIRVMCLEVPHVRDGGVGFWSCASSAGHEALADCLKLAAAAMVRSLLCPSDRGGRGFLRLTEETIPQIFFVDQLPATATFRQQLGEWSLLQFE